MTNRNIFRLARYGPVAFTAWKVILSGRLLLSLWILYLVLYLLNQH